MKTFKEFQEEKDYKEISEGIVDSAGVQAALTGAGDVLGLGIVGLIIGYGGLLLLKGYKHIGKSGIKTFQGIKDAKKASTAAKTSPLVKKIATDIEKKERLYKEELKDVYDALSEKNAGEAKTAFTDLDSKIKNDKKIRMAVMSKIADVYGPPVHHGSTGNESYKVMKQVVGQREAKAAAMTSMAFIKKIGGGVFKEGE